MRSHTFFSFITAVLAATTTAACTSATPEEPTFEAVVERVIAPACTFGSCHAAPTNAAQLDLSPQKMCDTLINRPSCLFPERMLVVPGSPEESFFFHKLTGDGLHEMPTGACATGTPTNLPMPYGAAGLDDANLALVHDWILAGAKCNAGPKPEPPAGPALASITTSRSVFSAGETIAVTITLDQPAPAGGQPVTVEWETGALSAPVQISVPATESTFRFDAFAMRPTARFVLRARTGNSVKEIMLRVEGLEIAEVLADPTGNDDGAQWIKLHNTSAMPIDLSGYKLKAGQGNYDAITVDLAGTIEPGACAVIGGPMSSAANGNPEFAQLVDFAPNLPHAGGQATGFAVFDTTAKAIGGIATPVDTMLVGATNPAQLRGPDGEIATPFCGTPSQGTSALRTGPSSCVQAAMQPRACN